MRLRECVLICGVVLLSLTSCASDSDVINEKTHSTLNGNVADTSSQETTSQVNADDTTLVETTDQTDTTKQTESTGQVQTTEQVQTSTQAETTKQIDTTTQTETTKQVETTTHIENTTQKQTTTKENVTSKPTEETTTKGNAVDIGDTGLMRDMTTAQIVRDMGIGINLGNTFESCGDWITGNSVKAYETAWGSPVITKEMIKGYATEGFGVLRIPVAWSNMMGADYAINPDYIARIKEIVDWTIDSGMYAIINIHWDGGWWENFPTDKAECMKKYTTIWKQIADAFKDYGDKLIFESLNEEGCWDTIWNRYSGSATGKAEAYGLLNQINQVFVDLVRNSGGNNGKRHLLIAGYATDISLTCDSYYKVPTDSVNRCAVSVHYYTPVAYCILTEDADWAKAQTTWGSASDINELNKNMKLLYDTYASKGVPVIIGEFGVVMDNKDKENAILFLKSVAELAYDYGMCPVLWDTTSNYSFYNRYSCSMSEYPELKKAFHDILN